MKNKQETEQVAWSGKKVLIVEDSKLMQEQLALIYESVGMQVVGICEDGVQALEKYKETKPDLVSLDIILPDMNGIECFRELKKVNANVQCFFVSVLGSHIADKFKEDIPPHLFLTKPLMTDPLKDSLRKVFA